MAEFQRVVDVDAIPDPGKGTFEVADRIVVISHVDGSFYCIDDVCTHDGGPLGEGCLTGHAVACPRHGAEFDVRTGEALTMPATQPTAVHEVKVEDGGVWVRVTED